MSVQVEVVDAVFGRPAAGVSVQLLRDVEATWQECAAVRTDEAGRVAGPASVRRGRYRLVLSLDDYFAGLGVEPFQSRVDVIFRVFHHREQVRLLLVVTPSSCSFCRLTGPDGAATSPAG